MIYYENNFNLDLPANYDGKFDWDCFKEYGCFGNTKIEPMDFDGVVERKRNYLIFETKDDGKSVPKGQEITLHNLNKAKSFTVVTIWPKRPPFKKMEILYHNDKTEIIEGHINIINKIKAWYEWADKDNRWEE